jgi:WD40 repeat protein/serine/threonine protein kinase
MNDRARQGDSLRKIDEVCDAFEKAIAITLSGDAVPPSLQEYVARVDEADQELAVEMLLALDQHYGGKDKQQTDYLEELAPEHHAAVMKFFSSAESPMTESFHSGEASAETLPSQIGPYKVLRRIGFGGMGEVYLAEQTSPVRRRVALKVIKAGLNTKDVVARFEAERQALAMMDHQNIAKVLDLGVTDDGQLYFAMEYVQGIPITEYCDKYKLSLNDRLVLFGQVCRAIQHSHQKGVIHRDLKPSNVLVTRYDDVPVVKVIDFGLAKALQWQTRLTDKTLVTRIHQVLGTWEYMSPEQAKPDELGVDTRTDVYSLGVLLYELLTGSTPLESERINELADYLKVKLICEDEAPRPSARLSDSGDAITGISEQRQIDPRLLSLKLKGELDWIAVKALEKDRVRRYDGAGALADDVQRYLEGEPIAARPPSVSYRLQKAVRKHKAAFITGSVIVLLLVAGLAATGTFWRKAVAAQKEAVANEEKAVAAQKEAVAAQELAEEMAKEADSQRKKSETTKAEAIRNLEDLEHEKKRTEQQLNYIRTNRAAGELELGRHEQAAALLETIPFERRQWEARYLLRQAKGTPLTIYSSLPAGEIAFSSDGRWIISATSIWDAETGTERFKVPSDTKLFDLLGISPDGKRMVTGSDDGTMTVRDFQTGQGLLTLKGHVGRVSLMAFSPDGRRIVSVSDVELPDVELPDVELPDVELPDVELPDTEPPLEFPPTGSPPGAPRLSRPEQPCPEPLPGLSEFPPLTIGTVAVKVWDAGTGHETLSFTLKRDIWNMKPMSFSPDGKRLVFGGSSDNTVNVWDTETGQHTLTLEGHLDSVSSVSFSPDGKRIVGGSGGGAVEVWDAETGQLTAMLKGHTNEVTSVAFSPDGRLVVSGSKDNTAKVWDMETSQETLSFKGHTSEVTSVAFSPDGRRIISGTTLDYLGGDYRAKVWDVERGTKPLEFTNDVHLVDAVFSFDDKQIVGKTKYSDRIIFWDATTRRQIDTQEISTGLYDGVVISKGGRYVVTWSNPTVPGSPIPSIAADKEQSNETGTLPLVFVHDTSIGKNTLNLHAKEDHGPITTAAISPNGAVIVVGYSNGTLSAWDGLTGKNTLTLSGHENEITTIAIGPDERIIASGAGSIVQVWDSSTGQNIHTFGQTGNIRTVAVSPDGRTIAANGSSPRGLMLWDVATGHRRAKTKYAIGNDGETTFGIGGMSSLTFSPNSQRIVGCTEDGEVIVWDVASGQELLAYKKSDARQTHFSSCGDKLLLVLGRPARVRSSLAIPMFEGLAETLAGIERVTESIEELFGGHIPTKPVAEILDARARVEILPCHDDVVTSTSGDSERFLTGSLDGTAKLWDAPTGKLIRTFSRHRTPILGVDYRPEKNRLATAHSNGNAIIWDASNGKALLTLHGNGQLLSTVALSSDCKRIVTGGGNMAVLWNGVTGEKIRTVRHDQGPVTTVAFSPDDEHILSVSTKLIILGGDSWAEIRVWSVNSDRESIVFPHGAFIFSAAFTQGGDQIVTIDDKNNKITWEKTTGTQISNIDGFGLTIWNSFLISSKWIFSVNFRIPLRPKALTASPAHFRWDKSRANMLRVHTNTDYDPWTEDAARRQAWEPDWSERDAMECESAENWFAARFHLRRLSQLKPNDESVKSRLEHAKAMLAVESAPTTSGRN